MSGTVRRHAAHSARVVCAMATLLASGCARLVTLDPAIVSKQNDDTWNVRSAPHASALSSPDSASAVQPLPFARRPEVAQALRSAPDALGIPAGLYAIDPLLSTHRREMDSQASARHQVGTGVIVSSLLFGALSAWAISMGTKNANSSNSQTASSASETVAYGYILAAFSTIDLFAGIAVVASSADATPLQRYYRETYTAAPR